MEVEKIFEVILYAVPALITGMIAYYFFKEHTKNEDGRRRFLLHKDIQVNTLPIRLQAYERMALFLERIAPAKLLVRVSPTSSDESAYESLLVATIEQEFEHNLSQQVYVTASLWKIIKLAKDQTISNISQMAEAAPERSTAQDFKLALLTQASTAESPLDIALAAIRKETEVLI